MAIFLEKKSLKNQMRFNFKNEDASRGRKGWHMKGSIIRGMSFSNLGNKTLEEALSGPKRVKSLAYCERCGCRLSQYRAPEDTLCCSCQRALNPLLKSA